MKILVTGATGFIGKHLIKELHKFDVHIVATSRSIKNTLPSECKKKVEYIPFDINQHHINLFEYFNKPDKLIHLAWEGLPNYNELFHIEKNLFNQITFIKNLIQNGLKDITVTGTCFEYGLQEGCLNESFNTNPCTSYGISKDTLRKYLEQLKIKSDFHLKWMRLFYLFGKGQNPESLLGQLDKALLEKKKDFKMSKGNQLRDYLNVSEAAKYITLVAFQNKVSGIINCCSGKPVSILQLVKNHIKKKNEKIVFKRGFYAIPNYEPLNFWGDNKKIKKLIENKKLFPNKKSY